MDAAVKFPTSPKAVKAAQLTLHKRMSVEQAFQAIARNCLEQIQGNEAGVVRCQDAEFVHQMRVGLRRLDAAFALFGALLRPPPAITEELAWLMDQLGPVRDWDVFIAATLPRIADAMPAQGALARVQEAARERSEVLHAQASAAVASARYTRLLGALEKWVARRGWRDDCTATDQVRLKAGVADFAAGVVAHERRRLRKRGGKLKDADPARRHRVRIAAKRARYATEFFAALFPGKQVRPYVRALAGLQERLGWLNDAAVAGRLLDQLGNGDAALREGTALVRGYLACCGAEGERAVRRQWKKFTALAPPH